ncbi:MAG TPA: DUF2628 domain-containing protein [Xanthobacteraceae bacterium]|nr:DUF2628 domain-containing protein [Xanthobacteraceae bacterium]
MTTYLVFEPPERDGDPAARAERIVFVPDRFSWGAFLVAPLWMLWRRLWLIFLAYLMLMAAVTVGLRFAGVGPGARFLVMALIALLVGFEAANLRRWALLRDGWRERGPIVGHDLAAAERRFFDAYVATAAAREAAAAGRPAAAPASRPAASDVVGLFPQPGAGR